MQSYSQNKEDIAIKKYFDSIKCYGGTLLDLGANDGITLSNSALLIEHGWNADLVEADINAGGKLLRRYMNNDDVAIHQIGISDKTGRQKFYSSGEHLKTGDTGLLSSLKKEETKRWKNEQFYEIEVNVFTYEDFKNQLAVYNPYSFITIDIEGMESVVLPHINLNFTRCICIEHNGRENDLKLYNEICVEKFKMKELLRNGENIIYIR